MPYTISAVASALTVLEVVSQAPKLGVTQIAQQAGFTKSQTFRLLDTLEHKGYIHKDTDTRTYTLGYKALYIGERAKSQIDLLGVIRPFMDKLSEICRENVHLIARERTDSVCLDLRESPQQVRLYAEVGRLGPLHAGGGSRVLLAYAPREIVDKILSQKLHRYTPKTVTDPEKLKEILERIRKDGYHETVDDLDEGAYSIAAPIRDHTGRVIAALSIAGPTSRLNDTTRSYYVKLVIEFSQKISDELGYHLTVPVRLGTEKQSRGQ